MGYRVSATKKPKITETPLSNNPPYDAVTRDEQIRREFANNKTLSMPQLERGSLGLRWQTHQINAREKATVDDYAQQRHAELMNPTKPKGAYGTLGR